MWWSEKEINLAHCRLSSERQHETFWLIGPLSTVDSVCSRCGVEAAQTAVTRNLTPCLQQLREVSIAIRFFRLSLVPGHAFSRQLTSLSHDDETDTQSTRRCSFRYCTHSVANLKDWAISRRLLKFQSYQLALSIPWSNTLLPSSQRWQQSANLGWVFFESESTKCFIYVIASQSFHQNLLSPPGM